mmetsp:Transcript_15736/g.44030  ORF Transcript_15736/g.44030 Transcript_15736/m.44030 type:complete len:166 (-) Transcript_15736:1538-2035(-)
MLAANRRVVVSMQPSFGYVASSLLLLLFRAPSAEGKAHDLALKAYDDWFYWPDHVPNRSCDGPQVQCSETGRQEDPSRSSRSNQSFFLHYKAVTKEDTARYKILKNLGHGTQGAVALAWDLSMKQLVAIKSSTVRWFSMEAALLQLVQGSGGFFMQLELPNPIHS